MLFCVSDNENTGPDPEVVTLRQELGLLYVELRRLQEENRRLKEEVEKSRSGFQTNTSPLVPVLSFLDFCER